jgi:hypothetical protein
VIGQFTPSFREPRITSRAPHRSGQPCSMTNPLLVLCWFTSRLPRPSDRGRLAVPMDRCHASSPVVAARRQAGDLRCPRGHQGRGRQGGQCDLAALPRALHAQRPCRQARPRDRVPWSDVAAVVDHRTSNCHGVRVTEAFDRGVDGSSRHCGSTTCRSCPPLSARRVGCRGYVLS